MVFLIYLTNLTTNKAKKTTMGDRLGWAVSAKQNGGASTGGYLLCARVMHLKLMQEFK